MSALSAMGVLVRRADPDRFLCTLFAPPERRDTLFALYAFNHELARAWEVASHPTLALIRLQWWREVLEGAPRRHEVATPLMAEVAAGRLAVADLVGLVDGRERIAEGLSRLEDWTAYLEVTAGALARTASRTLGGDVAVLYRFAALGSAYGAAGTLWSAGLWGGQLTACPPPEMRLALAQWAWDRLGAPAPLERATVAAGLVGVLARRDLRRPGRTPVRGLSDRLAVTAAALRGRV